MFENEVSNAAKMLIETAEKAIREHKCLDKIIIMNLPPIIDDDGKARLTNLFNEVLQKGVSTSVFKEKIMVGEYNFDAENSLFRSDGWHFTKHSALNILTNCPLQTLKKAENPWISQYDAAYLATTQKENSGIIKRACTTSPITFGVTHVVMVWAPT